MNRYRQQMVLPILIWVLSLPNSVQAQTASCASPTITNVQFGTVDFTTNVVNVNGSISWSCSSTGILGILLAPQTDIALCLNLNTGTGGTQAHPRLLSKGSDILQYQLYSNAPLSQIWGSTATPTTPIPLLIHVSVPASLVLTSTATGTATFYAQLSGIQTTAPAGAYTSSLIATFSGSYTFSQNTPLNSCTSGTETLNSGSAAAFTTTATVQKFCLVTTNNVSLGAVPSTAVNTTASNAINVTCTNGTPYYIGLSPSNGSNTGAGIMSGSISGNVYQLPYQLSSTAGPSGTIWGNTATSTTLGNGVGGSGNGVPQALTVYATVPSANYRPDTYSDTVTVNVNY